jgi:hypothetical protein
MHVEFALHVTPKMVQAEVAVDVTFAVKPRNFGKQVGQEDGHFRLGQWALPSVKDLLIGQKGRRRSHSKQGLRRK